MQLDEINENIFEHLLHYARFSAADISKVVKLSKVAVTKRIQYLLSEQYISRFDAIINWQKLPFTKKVYFLRYNSEYSTEFERKITSEEAVFSLIKLVGMYNYQIWCFFKNKAQQKSFEKMLKDYDSIDFEVDELFFPKVSFFNKPVKIPMPEIHDKLLNLKKIDIKILKRLAEGHGRDSIYDISEAIGEKYDSVQYHFKNLLNAGYFESIVAQPGESKFTLQTTGLIIELLSKDSMQIIMKKINNLPKILSVASGKKNRIMIHFTSITHEEYRETLHKIFALCRNDVKSVPVFAYWDKAILNNRYPLQYLL